MVKNNNKKQFHTAVSIGQTLLVCFKGASEKLTPGASKATPHHQTRMTHVSEGQEGFEMVAC